MFDDRRLQLTKVEEERCDRTAIRSQRCAVVALIVVETCMALSAVAAFLFQGLGWTVATIVFAFLGLFMMFVGEPNALNAGRNREMAKIMVERKGARRERLKHFR